MTPEQLAVCEGFTIDVDQNTNQVTFTSKMPKSYSVYWEYGPMPAEGDKASISGTSTNDVYQLGIAFKGNYYVRMGVQTRGGIVFSDRAPFSIDKLNTSLLSDQLWTLLTGGVDHSKTWMLDLDADGQSIKFHGPKYFYTAGANWNNFHNSRELTILIPRHGMHLPLLSLLQIGIGQQIGLVIPGFVLLRIMVRRPLT